MTKPRHCVKSVQIQTRKSSVFGHSYTVRNENKGSDMLDQDQAKDLKGVAIIADSIFNGIYGKE